MLKDDKNLKDIDKSHILKDSSTVSIAVVTSWQDYSGAYRKLDKLITALYMITDIMDKGEPLRNKLRVLGVGILSDIHVTPSEVEHRIYEIVSFLDIAKAINLISEMNSNILKKEFLELHKSLKEYISVKQKSVSLENLLLQSESYEDTSKVITIGDPKYQSTGNSSQIRESRTRIGIQRGSTLMKALSDRTKVLSNNKSIRENSVNFNTIKKQRRNDILNVIKNNNGSATIKDIRISVKDKALESLMSCGEKTLQRELISMVKDGVLNKTGEKRWSMYFIK